LLPGTALSLSSSLPSPTAKWLSSSKATNGSGKAVNSLSPPLCLCVYQGLKYNFHGGGTAQLSGPPVRSQTPFIFWAHASIAGSQIINDRLDVLNMTFVLFFFAIL